MPGSACRHPGRESRRRREQVVAWGSTPAATHDSAPDQEAEPGATGQSPPADAAPRNYGASRNQRPAGLLPSLWDWPGRMCRPLQVLPHGLAVCIGSCGYALPPLRATFNRPVRNAGLESHVLLDRVEQLVPRCLERSPRPHPRWPAPHRRSLRMQRFSRSVKAYGQRRRCGARCRRATGRGRPCP